MEMIIDTCSLVSLAKQYLPLDSVNCIEPFLTTEIKEGRLILLDSIQEECKHVSGGIAMEKFPILKDNSFVIKTENMVPKSPRAFYNKLNNNYCVSLIKRTLSVDQFETQKEVFLSTGDGRMILYINNMAEEKSFTVITEESRSQNDAKVFKKLPLILDQMNVKTITVSDYLKMNGYYLDRQQ